MVGTKPIFRSAGAALGLALGAAAFAPAVHAMPGATIAPAAIADAVADCSAPALLGAAVPSKSAQIIGGTSALDAIRAQQATPPTHPLFAGSPAPKFEPAAAPAPRNAAACNVAERPFSIEPRFARQPARFAAVRPSLSFAAPARSELVLGSRMVPIGRTSFDAQWNRVSAARANLAPTLAALGLASENRGELIASVNSWVNRRIAHAEDSELFGRSDYWADAATTLRLGRGDCEDFALLKMELLAAAGVKREDMMLTLARDLIRRRDHAVLLVKTDEGFVMLDNVGSAPLDASQSHGYRPVMSLGTKQSFLHGY